MTDSSVSRLFNLQHLVDSTVSRLRCVGTDLQAVEVKKAAGRLPRSAVESVCAFANTEGGVLIFGLTDGDFRSVDINAPKVASDLASACSDMLAPAIRPEVDIARVDGRPVVVARVNALDHQQRPCYLKLKGMHNGTYLRTHDGDRRLNSYEVHIMVSGRGQPDSDTTPVEGTALGDLDDLLVAALLTRLRETRGPVFARSSDEEVLHMMGVLAEPDAGAAVTVAGLVALGRYPQQFFPQLAASFVVLPTPTGEPMADGTRFLDNRSLDGPIPMIVSAALDAMYRNMRRRSVVAGAGRQDIWDYPIEAVREVVANALMHRDYHPSAHSSQVRISLYPDRFEVTNVGGLHGPNANRTDVHELISRGVTATRNARLAKLLEDVVIPGTARPVCENRGSGLRAAVAALRQAGMPPPILTDNVSELRVTIHRSGKTQPEKDAVDTLERLEPTDGRINAEQQPSRDAVDTSKLLPRERQIAELLSNGPKNSSELATRIGISQQATLRWLNRMADNGTIRSTEPTRRNRRNRWELTTGQHGNGSSR